MQNIKLFRLFFLLRTMPWSLPPSFFPHFTHFSLASSCFWEKWIGSWLVSKHRQWLNFVKRWKKNDFIPSSPPHKDEISRCHRRPCRRHKNSLPNQILFHIRSSRMLMKSRKWIDDILEISGWQGVCVCGTMWRWTQMELNWTAAAVCCVQKLNVVRGLLNSFLISLAFPGHCWTTNGNKINCKRWSEKETRKMDFVSFASSAASS